MAPWWEGGKYQQKLRGTPVVVKMENPNWSISEIDEDNADYVFPQKNKFRGKNAKQLTWVLLLKAHRAAGCLSSLASAVRLRVNSRETDESVSEATSGLRWTRFYSFIKGLLYLSIGVLVLETIAYSKGWNMTAMQLKIIVSGAKGLGIWGLFDWVYATWVIIRVGYLAPPLQWLANGCIVLFLIQSLDRLVLCLGCFWIRLRKIKPVAKVGPVDLEGGDGDGYFPMVLVQIPMCNEREVYQQSIGAVCNLDWPKERLLIQVLDDSDDPTTQMLIKEEVHYWQGEGANIIYRHRVDREGYKAGNLKSAMSCSYVKDYEFVAIFDADFQPTPNFLKQTVIHFKDNEEVGLVQARWSFVNKDENLLTRLQYINLSFHFEVEQQVNGNFIDFFGFNGTAGVGASVLHS